MLAVTPSSVSTDLDRIRARVEGGRNHALAHSYIDEMYVEPCAPSRAAQTTTCAVGAGEDDLIA